MGAGASAKIDFLKTTLHAQSATLLPPLPPSMPPTHCVAEQVMWAGTAEEVSAHLVVGKVKLLGGEAHSWETAQKGIQDSVGQCGAAAQRLNSPSGPMSFSSSVR